MLQHQNTRGSSKSNTAVLFNRYVWLVDTIYRAGRLSFEEINERWVRSSLNDTGEELPLKTFHNHKNAIQQVFDINIACDRRAGYLYYIENAEDMKRGGVRTWLLNTFAVNQLVNESRRLKRRILFEEIPSGQKYLTTIIETMRENRTLALTYKMFQQPASFSCEVEPYCVKVFRQRWYMVAHIVGTQRIRIYSLDRIEALEPTNRSFKLPAKFDGRDFFAQSFGITVDEQCAVEKIRIRVTHEQSNYLRTLPLHATQNETQHSDSYSIFEYRLRPTYDFQQEIRKYGADVEVLEPQWLRNKFYEEAKANYELYNKMEGNL